MKENNRGHRSAEQDILFTRSIKAGKRIYYIDVKQSSKGDMYLALTESKRIVGGDADMPTFSYEKHKLFVYPEDFDKFTGSLNEAIQFICDKQGQVQQRTVEMHDSDIKLDDLEF